jgi:glyoxylase-like metal-dependent hydrolase (beta-lactamase superfamily II)
MEIRPFFDPDTWTLTYVVHEDGVGVVIDSVLDYDPASGRTATHSIDAVSRYIDDQRLEIPYVLDTHAHADHMSAMQVVKERTGARTVIGDGIQGVQQTFKKIFHLGDEFAADGSQFDVLMAGGTSLSAGPLEIEGIHTPGHTRACLTYRIGDALFVGDVLFQPDYGTARADFPGGSADDLFDSVQRLYELPGEMRVFTGHDYQPDGRPLEFESTIAAQREHNVQLTAKTSRSDFVTFRETRDAELDVPRLILPSVQVNIRAGRMPEPESDGHSYLKIPVNVIGGDQ